MLQEAIYKFKASGPMLLPELIDNYWIGEIKAYEDYAILPYEVHIPQPIDKVIDMFDSWSKEKVDDSADKADSKDNAKVEEGKKSEASAQ